MNQVIEAIDLFCGAGGLTHGLELSGIRVKAGYDLDSECEFPYEANNNAKFFNKDIKNITGKHLFSQWNKKSIKLLAGCAPCQPFSTYTLGKKKCKTDDRWELLEEFARLIEETLPELVTMENVPSLEKQSIFSNFLDTLKANGYSVSYQIVTCTDYGIPQIRKRLVLLASRLGTIELISKTHKKPVTISEIIQSLDALKSGQQSPSDPLHICSKLSPLNIERIQHSKPEGTWRDWPNRLKLSCHKKTSGERYGSVYGRMSWNKPAPTMTTQCYGYGNGRFGHPDQDRAISLREAALFQTFPMQYHFLDTHEKVSFKKLGKLIGNAVPVKLGEVIGNSFLAHLNQHHSKKKSLPNVS